MCIDYASPIDRGCVFICGNTHSELTGMFGEEVVSRFRIVHHNARDNETLFISGKTDTGVIVQINKDFALADLKITTGCITPHQLAGYSGGRKSVLPGIAGLQALKGHHSFPIRPEKTSLGWLEGNPFHEEALKAAYIAGVDFIVNSIDNENQEMVLCVCGELNKAHLAGVEVCRKIWAVPTRAKPDVVIVSPGGYPRDFDLHQSQKAVGCAEMFCKEGGQIILCAEMRDGVGKPGKLLKEFDDLQKIIDQFKEIGYTPDSLSKTYMWARALQNYNISILGSELGKEELEDMFFDFFDSPEQAIASALDRYGNDAVFMVIPYASDSLPV